jgi:hypothetical protein
MLPGILPLPPIAPTFSNEVTLPSAPLDWTGGPRVELGYRFPQGFGEALVSYRSLVTEGQTIRPNFDVDGGRVLLNSRLNVNVVDLDYGSREYSLGPHWEMQWRVGARLASVYFDSRATAVVLEQRTSNDFFGAGPHLLLDLRRGLRWPGWGFYGRLEGAAVVGRIDQAFEESFLFLDGVQVGGATDQHQTQAVPVVHTQVGLTWDPPWASHWLRFVGGYEFEGWYYLGWVNASRGDMTVQGAFFRAEWSF